VASLQTLKKGLKKEWGMLFAANEVLRLTHNAGDHCFVVPVSWLLQRMTCRAEVRSESELKSIEGGRKRVLLGIPSILAFLTGLMH